MALSFAFAVVVAVPCERGPEGGLTAAAVADEETRAGDEQVVDRERDSGTAVAAEKVDRGIS